MKRTAIISLLLISSIFLKAQEFPYPRIACGPWIQAAGENEFTVVWQTNVPCVVWVEVAPDDGSHFYQTERPKYYESLYGRRPVGTLHHVRVAGLQPGTTMRYRIYQQALLLDKGNERMVFGEAYGNDFNRDGIMFKATTLDTKRPECRFSVVNDIHGDDSLFRLLTADLTATKPDFVVFNGDMLSQIETTEQIAEGYMRSAGATFAPFIPLFALRGNHENRGSASYDYMKWFPTPSGQPYYTFRQGPVFFIALDCGEDKPDSDIRYYGLSLTDRLREEQAEWLRKVVATDEFKSAPLKVVILHIPPYEEKGEWHGTHEIRRLFLPLLNEAGIDLMLSGHLHSHHYIEKGAAGNNFPILINSNRTRADLTASSKGVEIKIIDATGAIVHTYTVKNH